VNGVTGRTISGGTFPDQEIKSVLQKERRKQHIKHGKVYGVIVSGGRGVRESTETREVHRLEGRPIQKQNMLIHSELTADTPLVGGQKLCWTRNAYSAMTAQEGATLKTCLRGSWGRDYKTLQGGKKSTGNQKQMVKGEKRNARLLAWNKLAL